MICRILLLIILTSCVSGSFVVNVTQTCYQAEENHNITLEWTFTPTAESFSIICEKEADNTAWVFYHVHEGVEVSESQDETFSGRVQSDKDALREGRIRLQLSRLRTDDSGLYLCEIYTCYCVFISASCRLNVTAATDQLQSQSAESWGRNKLSIGLGLAAGSVLLFCLLVTFYLFLSKKEKRRKHLQRQGVTFP
ncbi:uncharacterized protein LOC109198953 isoform X2 [Oreochromis niloticus]|uniref:uncharacterized protein LOC109198953 isoform X2 n=1 Tax=Oreochromis niloticus TaxID=8128 RepID=UPI000DF3C42E|nr:uncharacterized protein LOC109198953 isoform X2 [Oreochromis niloticus]CAI5659825.1 unnamed protein product [Mustela putorius furo]